MGLSLRKSILFKIRSNVSDTLHFCAKKLNQGFKKIMLNCKLFIIEPICIIISVKIMCRYRCRTSSAPKGIKHDPFMVV